MIKTTLLQSENIKPIAGHTYAYVRTFGRDRLHCIGMIADDKRERWARLLAGLESDSALLRDSEKSDVIAFMPTLTRTVNFSEGNSNLLPINVAQWEAVAFYKDGVLMPRP